MSGNRQLDVKLKQLHLGQVKKDLQLKERAAQVESERVLLQAEVELAEAQLLAEAEIKEDCRSQCLSRMDEQAMTSNERVKRFLNENSPVNNLRKKLQGVETEVPVQDNLKRKEAGTDKLTKETMLSKGALGLMLQNGRVRGYRVVQRIISVWLEALSKSLTWSVGLFLLSYRMIFTTGRPISAGFKEVTMA